MNLWRAFESVPGLVAIPEVWRRPLGDEYHRAQPFMRATGALAESIWRGGAKPWPVVHHNDGDIVAVCPDTHDTVKVTLSELSLTELDLKAVCVALSRALKLKGVPQQTGGRRLWWLGHQPWSETEQINVYLAVPSSQLQAAEILRAAAFRSPQGGVILLPTVDLIPADVHSELTTRGYAVQSLEGLMVWSGVGELACVQPPEEVIPALLGRQAQRKKDRRHSRRFPTPDGSKWSDVDIRLLDPQTVKVTVRGVTEEHTATTMGMTSVRTGKPTKQWVLLRMLAAGRGHVPWNSGRERAENQKQKEELVKHLRRFFGICGKPILGSKAEWRCVFTIHPEPD